MSVSPARTASRSSKNFWYADTSPNALTVRLSGNSTQTVESSGITVAAFDGSGDFLRISSPTAFLFGTEAFTVEFWVKQIALGEVTWISTSDPTDVSGINIGLFTSKFRADIGFNTISWTTTIVSSQTIVLNRWYHVALVCTTGGVLTLYVNGISVGTATRTFSIPNVNNNLLVGGRTISNQTSNSRITGVRVVKGTALYTGNFAVPTVPPTAVPGTTLLLNFKTNAVPTWFGDTSTSFIAVSSAPGVTLFDEKFGAYSAKFENSYLTLSGSSPNISSGDHTVEVFVNFASANSQQPILFRGTPTTVGSFLLYLDNSSNLVVVRSTNGTSHDVSVNSTFKPKPNLWYHIAFSVSGLTARLFVNGKLIASNTSYAAGFNTNQTWLIGRFENFPGIRNFTGRMAGLRITNTAIYTAEFQCPNTLPAHVTGTQLLMNFTGTEAPFVLMNTATTTSTYLSGVSAVGIINPVKRGDNIKSVRFDGTGDFFRVTSGDAFTFGTGDFTIEYWIKIMAGGETDCHLSTADPTDYQGIFVGLQQGAGTGIYVLLGNGTTWVYGSNTTQQLNIGQWHHVAVSSILGTVTTYVDGVSGAQIKSGGLTLTNSNSSLCIGGRTVISQTSNGYMTGIRIVKGTGLYTRNFSVPTSKSAELVPNTVLLMNCDSLNVPPWYRDTSTRSNTIFLSGNTQQNFEDNRTVSAYTNKEGYILTTLDTPLTADFDLSFFVKFDNAICTADEHIILQPSNGFAIIRKPDNTLVYNEVGVGDILGSVIKIQDTNWHYVQLNQSSNVASFYIDGVLGNTVFWPSSWSAKEFYIMPYNQTAPVAAEITGLRISRSGSISTVVPTSAIQPSASTAALLNFNSADVPTLWYGDTSGAHRMSYLSGSPIQINEGNGIVSLSSTNGHVNLTTLNLSSSRFTVEAFVYPYSLNSGDGIFGQSNSVGTNVPKFVAYMPTASAFQVRLQDGTNTTAISADKRVLQLNQWNHIAVVRDTSNLYLYANGTLRSSATTNLNLTGITAPFQVGWYGEGNRFNGKIAGVRAAVGATMYNNNFPVPTVLPQNTSRTQLLLNFNATSAPLVWYRDESTYLTKPTELTVTPGTPVQYEVASRVKAAQFNGDSFITAYSPASGFAFGTGDWTIEFFVQPLSGFSGSGPDCWVGTAEPTDYNGIFIGYYLSNRVLVTLGSDNASWAVNNTFPTSLVVGKWYHIAVVVNSGTLSLYINGVRDGFVSTTVNIPNANNRLVIGGRALGSQYSMSRITGLRVVKGFAVYTSNFTPPTTLPSNITNTELLMDFGSEVLTGLQL